MAAPVEQQHGQRVTKPQNAVQSGGAEPEPAPESNAFQPLLVVKHFRECVDHLHDMPIEAFLQGCGEIKKLVCT